MDTQNTQLTITLKVNLKHLSGSIQNKSVFWVSTSIFMNVYWIEAFSFQEKTLLNFCQQTIPEKKKKKLFWIFANRQSQSNATQIIPSSSTKMLMVAKGTTGASYTRRHFSTEKCLKSAHAMNSTGCACDMTLSIAHDSCFKFELPRKGYRNNRGTSLLFFNPLSCIMLPFSL